MKKSKRRRYIKREEVKTMLDAKTTSELAHDLGVQGYRIAYAVQTGALPSPQIVAGRRLWTPQQAETARAYFEALRKGPNRGRPARETLPTPA